MSNHTNALSDELKLRLEQMLKSLCIAKKEIFLASVCTVDGFNIRSVTSSARTTEVDKLAAMASTIVSLSAASSQQLMALPSTFTTIETEGGNILFLTAMLLGKECVLTIAANDTMQLATARYEAMRLAKSIAELDNAQESAISSAY